MSSAPTANLCSAGTASAVSGNGPWTWNCSGSNGGSNAGCIAFLAAASGTGTASSGSTSGSGGSTTVVNGVCGSANGTTTNTAPSSNLCNAGTATGVIDQSGNGSGPWVWACEGSDTNDTPGTDVDCEAFGPRGSAPGGGTVSSSCPSNLAPPANFNPADPAASGYVLVWDAEFNNPSTSTAEIDTNLTGQQGFDLYPQQFAGYPNETYTINNDGTVTVTGGGNGLATAMPANNALGWLGTAFGCGGYFEASLAFTPANEAGSFWGMNVEHFAGKLGDQWPGQPTGYEHFIEQDFFEYDTQWAGNNTYGSAIRDWFGIWDQTCGSEGYCNVTNDGMGDLGGNSNFNNYVVTVPSSTVWTQPNTVAGLWVPGSSANGFRGSYQAYFNGQPTADLVTWVDQGAGTPPPTGNFSFSVSDQGHLVVFLGAGTFSWAHIWQLPAAAAASGNAQVTPQSGFNEQ